MSINFSSLERDNPISLLAINRRNASHVKIHARARAAKAGFYLARLLMKNEIITAITLIQLTRTR